MEATRKRMRATERENDLVEKATEVLAESNYRSATTARIAQGAGVSEAVIYQHFNSKRDLFLKVLERIGSDVLEKWAEVTVDSRSTKTALRQLGTYHYTFINESKAKEKVLFQAISEVDDPEIRESLKEHFAAFVEFIAGIVREGKAEGVVPHDMDETMAGWIVLSFGIGSGFMSLFGFEEELDRERLIRTYELIIKALTE